MEAGAALSERLIEFRREEQQEESREKIKAAIKQTQACTYGNQRNGKRGDELKGKG